MNKANDSIFEWITERIIVALISALLAGITLFLYPLVFSFLLTTHGSGAGKGLGLFGSYYALLFSKIGLFVIICAALSGFLMGPDRMASLFSFFWGTHEFWPRLEEKLNDWRDEHFSEGRMFILLMAILAIVLWVQFA